MKILYTATVLSHICQFHLPYLEELQKRGHSIHVAARDNLSEKNGLTLRFSDKHIEIPFQRSPFDKRNMGAYRELKALLAQEQYDLILCNTPVGGILTRLAARKLRKSGCKVLYMAHGFHFFKGGSRKNWLFYYPVEKYMARHCDILITITDEDEALAREKFPAQVGRIHGVGVSADRYHPAAEQEELEMRRAEGLSQKDFLILCTGELNQNKDQQTLIRAAAQVKEQIPNMKVLLAGNGPLEGELKDLANTLGLEDTVRFLGYRTDLERVVPCVDLVVSCSHREGMPLNIIEAMLCAKPIVAAVNRGTRELVKDGENGLLFQAGDVNALTAHILTLQDAVLRHEMGCRGLERAQAYTVDAVKAELMPLLEK